MTFDAAPTDLSGRTCIVTGANGGIGMATAEHFAACGARVLTTDLGDSFAGACESEHRAFDLLSEDGLAACCEWVGAARPDVLFNNAALFDMGSVLQADLAQYDRLFGLNVRAMYAVMQAASGAMVDAGIKGYAHDRMCIRRAGQILAHSEHLNLRVDEAPEMMHVRFRTLGDLTITGAFESDADTLEKIIEEVAATRITERGGRMDDKRSDSAMEDRKKEGYF